MKGVNNMNDVLEQRLVAKKRGDSPEKLVFLLQILNSEKQRIELI